MSTADTADSSGGENGRDLDEELEEDSEWDSEDAGAHVADFL